MGRRGLHRVGAAGEFSFNLTISGYLLTFLTMLAVSLIVSVLTARIKQQEQIRLDAEREKLRANLLRAVSHDLRTPLTSIVGATGAILDNALPPEKQRELLADVNADAQWLLRMIENQLTITRIQGETAPLHMETEVVEDVLAEAAIKFQKHFPDIKVDMDLCDDILLADMDAVLIEQVVLNMLENAVYHGKLAQALHRPIAIDVSLDVLYLLGSEKRQALKVFRSGGIDVDGVFCQLVQHVLIFLPRLVLKVLHIAQLIQILLPRCRSSYLLLSQDHDRHQTYEQKPNCPLRHLFGAFRLICRLSLLFRCVRECSVLRTKVL